MLLYIIVVMDTRDVKSVRWENRGQVDKMTNWVCRMTRYMDDGFTTRYGWSTLISNFMGLPIGTRVKTIWTTGFTPIVNIPSRGWYPIDRNKVERVVMSEIQQLIGPRIRPRVRRHDATTN